MALLLVGFVGGFLAAISPCVLPVLPVVLLGGATSTGAHRASWLRPLCIVAGLILSFTLFTLFGAVLLHLLGLPAGTLRALGIATLALLGLALLVPRVERLLERPFALIPQVRVGNSMVLRDLLIAGQGIGTLPDFVSHAPEARGELVRVLPDWELPAPEIFAVTASRLGMDARVTAFLDHLRVALRG